MARPKHAFNFPGADRFGCVRVNGLGACMISGTPFDFTSSFFYTAMQHVSDVTNISLSGTVFSYGAFSASRAAKYVHKALADKPDIVVVQLGTTDTGVSVRRHLFGEAPSKPQGPGVVSTMPPFSRTRVRAVAEWLKLLVCRALSIQPIHGDVDVYMNAMTEIVRCIQAAGAVAVLTTPFPHGDRTSDFYGLKFMHRLKQLCDETGAVFADTRTGLVCQPLSNVLLADRMHLSRYGHALAGLDLAAVLFKPVEAASRRNKPET